MVVAAGIAVAGFWKSAHCKPLVTNNPPFVAVALVVA